MKAIRDEREKLRFQINKFEEQKIAAIEKFIAAEITADEKAAFHRSVDVKLGALQADVAKLDRKIALKQEAVDYAIDYMDNAHRLWADAGVEMQMRYQYMIFPEGITYDLKEKKFGTAKMGTLYRLASTQKDAEASSESTLVEYMNSHWNLICSEIVRWKQIISKRKDIAYSSV